MKQKHGRQRDLENSSDIIEPALMQRPPVLQNKSIPLKLPSPQSKQTLA